MTMYVIFFLNFQIYFDPFVSVRGVVLNRSASPTTTKDSIFCETSGTKWNKILLKLLQCLVASSLPPIASHL